MLCVCSLWSVPIPHLGIPVWPYLVGISICPCRSIFLHRRYIFFVWWLLRIWHAFLECFLCLLIYSLARNPKEKTRVGSILGRKQIFLFQGWSGLFKITSTDLLSCRNMVCLQIFCLCLLGYRILLWKILWNLARAHSLLLESTRFLSSELGPV